MTDLPRPSQLGPDATIEDLVRSARAHGIELPYRVSLPEDTDNDPDMRPVTYRRRDADMVLPQRGGEKRHQFELIEGADDGTAWRVVYRRIPDRFQDIYQEIHREQLPEPDPAVAAPLIAEPYPAGDSTSRTRLVRPPHAQRPRHRRQPARVHHRRERDRPDGAVP